MVKALVKVDPPELVILKASVKAVSPVPVVSAWSRRRRASVVESVNEPARAFEMAMAYWEWAMAP